MATKLKVGDKIEYTSFGKKTRGVIKKIVLSDRKQLKVMPDYKEDSLVAIKMENVKKV